MFIKVDQLPEANVLSALNLVRDLFIKGRQKWNNLSYFDNIMGDKLILNFGAKFQR